MQRGGHPKGKKKPPIGSKTPSKPPPSKTKKRTKTFLSL